MKKCIIFILIMFVICQFHPMAQEADYLDGTEDFYAGQIENTFNYHWNLEESIHETYIDLDNDGTDDLYFEREQEILYGGDVVITLCYVYPLNGVRISSQSVYYTDGLDYGEMIYPSSISWYDQKLMYFSHEAIEGMWFSWEWFLDDGYLAVQMPGEVDTSYAWVFINLETGSSVEVLEIDSYTYWKHCSKVVNLGDDITALVNDTLVIDAGWGYDSCLWSTGDTTQLVEVICSEWGVGEWEISIEAIEGPCHYFDTINILIEDDAGIPTIKTTPFRFGPNPFHDELTIWNPLEEEVHFEIVSMLGKTVFNKDLPPGNTTFSLESLKSGLYFGSFQYGTQRKLVKIIKQN